MSDFITRLKNITGLNIHKEKLYQASLKVDKEKIRKTLLDLKKEGFLQFTTLTCIDWIEEKTFQLVYHLWHREEKLHLKVKIDIDRDAPIVETVSDIYIVAQTYEREVKEMFGVDFKGNKRLIPFILEDWNEIPPMRRDFNTREYVKDMYETEDRTEEIFKPRWKKYD